MKSYPLKSISLEEAIQLQFKLVDCVTNEFNGYEVLELGDLGVHKLGNIPQTTKKVEKVIAKFFNAQDACLVRGSGTGAIRESLAATLTDSREVLIHSSEVYSTTKTSFELLGITSCVVNYNDIEKVNNASIQYPNCSVALVQVTRQAIEDNYDLREVIESLHKQGFTIITDDNYAVMKTSAIGIESGANLSTFSTFKLLGPEGIGCIVGDKEIIDIIRKYHYSGGSQVQGFESLEALRGMIYAPVSLAIQANVIEEVYKDIKENKYPEVKDVYIANAQSKVLLVELESPIAPDVLKEAELLGALPHPVGSESKYEIAPLFYKVSGTMLKEDPTRINYWIRINPMRAGKETILRILNEAIKRVK